MTGTPEIEQRETNAVPQPESPREGEDLLYLKEKEKEALDQAVAMLKQIAADDAAAAQQVPQPTNTGTPSQQKTVSVPSDDQTVLASQAKGSTNSSVTWLAAYWLRLIKKALLYGWNVVFTPKKVKE